MEESGQSQVTTSNSTSRIRLRPKREKKPKRVLTVRGQIYHFILVLIFDVGVPLAIYFVLKNYIAAVWALLLAAVPALLMVVVKGIVERRLDVIGLLVFIAFGISGIVAATTGDARILVFEKSLVTSVLGVIFLLTLIPFRCCARRRIRKRYDENGELLKYHEPFTLRPILFYLAQEYVPLSLMVTPEETPALVAALKKKAEFIKEHSDMSMDHVTFAVNIQERNHSTTRATSLNNVGNERHNNSMSTNTSSTSTPSAPSPPSSPLSSRQPEVVLPISERDIELVANDLVKPEEINDLTWNYLWEGSNKIRKDIRILTFIWGIGLLLEFIGRLWMVFSSLTLDQV